MSMVNDDDSVYVHAHMLGSNLGQEKKETLENKDDHCIISDVIMNYLCNTEKGYSGD
jgi:hypothetical protein